MAYRKWKADKIFDGYRFVEGQVLVTDSSGEVIELIAENDAGDDVENYTGMLTPGLINCHCHLELSHLKGLIPEATGLVDFVFKIVTERHHSQDGILQAIEKAETEMLQNGIVAVGDICNNELTIPQKQKNRLRYYNFIEASGWLPAASQARFERAKQLAEQFSVLTSPFSIVPHAPYSVSANLWQAIIPWFDKKVVSIHNQEAKHENDFFAAATGDFLRMYEIMKIDNSHHQATGKSSLENYIGKLTGAQKVLLVHNTFTSTKDLEMALGQLNHDQLFFCLCPNANLYIERSRPPVPALMDQNCNVVLGTDSLASNWSLSILDEIKTISKHFPLVSLEKMLQWATSNGANALQLEQELGSFEKGKKPGIVVVSHDLEKAQRLL